jgi:hypothetical protein
MLPLSCDFSSLFRIFRFFVSFFRHLSGNARARTYDIPPRDDHITPYLVVFQEKFTKIL